MMLCKGPALCFDPEGEALAGVKGGQVKQGDIIIQRYQGLKGGPGMPEMRGVTGGADLPDEEISRRRKNWQPLLKAMGFGYMDR
jgi:dihydroxyacid dehydratase/phosphogluconate dehydratase